MEVFEYKGKYYNRQLFVSQKADSLYDLKKQTIESQLNKYESGMVNSKHPDLDLAFIDVWKLALESK